MGRALPDIHLFPDADALTLGAAEFVTDEAQRSIEMMGRFTIALSGGSTPRSLYETLATPAFAKRIDWDKWHLFWGDERAVHPYHADSNYRMTKLALLDHVEIPRENVHRVEAEHLPPVAARVYAGTIREHFGAKAPVFDLILLGMGEDGHTASLFPGDASVHEHTKLVTTSRLTGDDPARVTFTLPLINAARRVMFMITGENKADMVRRAIEPGLLEPSIPAGLVSPKKGWLHWFLSHDAASELGNIPV